MGGQLPSKQLEEFIGFVKECQETYQIAYSCVGDEDKRGQDLLHAIEFEANKYDLHREALRLQESRRERRRNKDLVQMYEPIVQYFQGASGKKLLEELRQLLGRQRKAEQYVTGHREYRKRIDDGR